MFTDSVITDNGTHLRDKSLLLCHTSGQWIDWTTLSLRKIFDTVFSCIFIQMQIFSILGKGFHWKSCITFSRLLKNWSLQTTLFYFVSTTLKTQKWLMNYLTQQNSSKGTQKTLFWMTFPFRPHCIFSWLHILSCLAQEPNPAHTNKFSYVYFLWRMGHSECQH